MTDRVADGSKGEATDLAISLTPEEQPETPARVEAPRLLVSAEAFAAMQQHGLMDISRECGGVMVGQKLEGEKGPVVLVEAVIPALYAEGHHGSVTFTHETWEQINQEKDQNYEDLRIVGWYHTHPGFGIFLSDYDEFIQKNFFDLPWQVAFVLDPRSGDTGAFGWVEGEIARLSRYDIYGAGEEKTARGETPVAPAEMAPPPVPVRAASGAGGVTVALLLGLLVVLTVVILGEISALRGETRALALQAAAAATRPVATAPAPATGEAPATASAEAMPSAKAEPKPQPTPGGEPTGGGGATEPGRTGD